MLPTSIPQASKLAPIHRMTVGPDPVNLETRFNDASGGIYSAYSPYDTQQDGVGFRQPYVWTGLNDSNTKKYIKRYDNTTFPEGSTLQDLQRVGKFMLSGTGIIYSGIQFTLQTQNAFNETRIWNPLSILTASGKQGLFGAIPRPVRHIESSGGILNTIATGLLSSIGISSMALNTKMPPDGTATKGLEALSSEVKIGSAWPSKGLLRYQTSVAGQVNFTKRYGATDGGGIVQNFLSSLASSLIKNLTRYIPSTTGGTADWQYRVEYSNSSNVFESLLADQNVLLKYSIIPGAPGYVVQDIHRFYPGKTGSDKNNWYYGTPQQGNSFSSEIDFMISDLKSGKFSFNKNYTIDADNQIQKMPRDASTTVASNQDLRKILGETTFTKITSAVSLWKQSTTYKIDPDFYTRRVLAYQDLDSTSKSTSFRKSLDNKTLVNKKFPGARQADEYNSLPPLKKSTGIPGELEDYDGIGSMDTIFFYFYDLVNNVYIPFRATLNGINENTSVDWEDVQYMGRADKLYMYKGFTRELNFGFTVVANSVSELAPMWRRINYLSGLTRPSKYTEGSKLGQFIYPPMIKFRIGDLYIDQPAIIRSYGLVIPEEALWETNAANTDYAYLVEKGIPKITSKSPTAQVPMQANIIITLALLEKERSETQKLRYFDADTKGFEKATPDDSTVKNGAEVKAQTIADKNAADRKLADKNVADAKASFSNKFDDNTTPSILNNSSTTNTGTTKEQQSSIDSFASKPPPFGGGLPVPPEPLPTFGGKPTGP